MSFLHGSLINIVWWYWRPVRLERWDIWVASANWDCVRRFWTADKPGAIYDMVSRIGSYYQYCFALGAPRYNIDRAVNKHGVFNSVKMRRCW